MALALLTLVGLSCVPLSVGRRARYNGFGEALVSGLTPKSYYLDVEYHGLEHVLLAMLRDPASLSARVLSRHGVGYDDVRSELVRLRDARPGA